jgi:GNAT superfamily N-acetyltransferase
MESQALSMSAPARSELTVRDATPADLAFIVDANAAMAIETEHKTLDRDVLARGVAAVLAKPERGFYLIAERDAAAVGCLLVTHEWSDWRNGDWWWLQSVYVAPAARRGGVFRALHLEVERRARAEPGVIGLRLYVERDNRTAHATYAALGLVETHYRLLEKEGLEGPSA